MSKPFSKLLRTVRGKAQARRIRGKIKLERIRREKTELLKLKLEQGKLKQ
jgi:hypothetical protein